ncbi:MAG: histidinol dehydrogenase [Chitinispirillaceae bacterium]
MPRQSTIPVVDINSSAGKRILKRIKAGREKRNEEITRTVSSVLEDIRLKGDKALFEYTARFDKVSLTPAKVKIDPATLRETGKKAPAELKRSIREAAKRIEAFHKKQGLRNFNYRSSEGLLQQIIKPLNRVGVYIPGGYTVYPSTVLMDVIPAKLAKVKEIVAVTPPREELDPAIAYALHYLKVDEVYRVGGAQAIAALAYGTKTIAPVDKIVGPGNAYVATAKRLVYGNVDIDSVAGPSEVVIVADSSADPVLVASDLLAQAEHGTGDETAVCIVENMKVAQRIVKATESEIEDSPVRKTLEKLPSHAISVFVTSSRKESMLLSDSIAPEHLQIMTSTAEKDLKLVSNASAVFLGMQTPVALGDYFIGTNHVLPTGGAARFASPLGVESFQKRISVAQVSRRGIQNAAEHAPRLARAESFVHHAMSVEKRAERG